MHFDEPGIENQENQFNPIDPIQPKTRDLLAYEKVNLFVLIQTVQIIGTNTKMFGSIAIFGPISHYGHR